MEIKKRKTLQELTIIDGFLFGAVMSDPENCRELLERILERPIRKVEVIKEKSLLYHPEYKGIRLDVFARDEEGTRFDVEMQVRTTPVEKRSRYYHSQMDMEMLTSGVPYDGLPDSYVIFLCDYDPFGQGKYRYTIESRCGECPDMPYEDGVHTVVLNNRGKNPGDVPKELVSFLQYTRKALPESEDEPGDDYIRRLQRTIRQIKSSREMGERYMQFQEMLQEEREEGRKEGRDEGFKEGRDAGLKEGRESLIIHLVSEDAISMEKGAEKLGIALEEFKKRMAGYTSRES